MRRRFVTGDQKAAVREMRERMMRVPPVGQRPPQQTGSAVIAGNGGKPKVNSR